jgi:hypothetical protein
MDNNLMLMSTTDEAAGRRFSSFFREQQNAERFVDWYYEIDDLFHRFRIDCVFSKG